MSTFIRGVTKKGLKTSLWVFVALLCVAAITCGIVFTQKHDFTVSPDNSSFEMVDDSSLLSNDGWNEKAALKLNSNLSAYGDNVALGNAGNANIGSLVSLGGYNWLVVYKQNGILTLYANESVGSMKFDSSSINYSDSDIRDYLNNEFYQKFISNIAYRDVENLIIPYGVDKLYYQAPNAQAVPLKTMADGDIYNSDGVRSDMIWLPSALEIGGFATTNTSPTPIANSFRTITGEGYSINSGLWNLSNNTRLQVNNAVLRSNVNNGLAVMKNGVITEGNLNSTYEIRPCINIAMPVVSEGRVLQAGAISSNAILATSPTPDFTSELEQYSTLSGNTFTISSTPATAMNFLIALSDAVKAGQSFAGYTFKLTCDVVFSSTAIDANSNVGNTVWDPIGRKNFPFSGTFDGQGHTVSGLCTAGSGLVGLFGYVGNATIERVAVINSTWYTGTKSTVTDDAIGCIVCTANNSTITQCYNEANITGTNDVGGIVGKTTGTSTVTNCYNLGTVAGTARVGGIAGTAVSIATSYTTTGNVAGSVTTSTNNIYVGSSKTTNTASAVADLYGTKSYDVANSQVVFTYDATVYTNWTFTKNDATNADNSTVDASAWTFSNTVNNKLPVLKCFLRNAAKTHTVSGSGTTIAFNTSTKTITIETTVAWETNNHMALVAWKMNNANFAIPTQEPGQTTYTLSIVDDDSYVDVTAQIEKMFSLHIVPVYQGFTASYAPSIVTATAKGSAWDIDTTESQWFAAGDAVTVTPGTNSQVIFGAFYKAATSDGERAQAGSTFVVGNSGARTVNISADTFGSTDVCYLFPTYSRVFNITLASAVPSGSDNTLIGTNDLTMTGTNSQNIAFTSHKGDSQVVLYNSLVSASVDNAYVGISETDFLFSRWLLESTEIGTSGNVSFNVNGGDANSKLTNVADSLYNITLTAEFELNRITILLTESGGNYGYDLVSITDSTAASMVLNDNGDKSIPVDENAAYYIYIKPAYASGYQFGSVSNIGAIEPQIDANGYVKISGLTASESRIHDIVYTPIQFSMNFAFELDDVASASLDSTTRAYFGIPSNKTNLQINATADSNITGSNYEATVLQSEQDKYFLSQVVVTYNGQTKTITRERGSSFVSTYSNLFGSITTLSALLSDNALNNVEYGATSVDVTLKFISLTRTVTVTEQLTQKAADGTDAVTQTSLGFYSIVEKGTTNAITSVGNVGQEYTITLDVPSGYTATMAELQVGTDSVIDFLTNGTTDFTLSANTTVTIYYTKTAYQVSIITNTTQEVDGLNVAYEYALNLAASATAYATPFYANYNDTITITGFNDLYDSGITTTANSASVKAKLQSIQVLYNNGTADVVLQNITNFNNCSYAPQTTLADAITFKFTYVILKGVSISLDTTGMSAGYTTEAILLDLINNDTNEHSIAIVSSSAASSLDCILGTNYTVRIYAPIFVQSQITTGVDSEMSFTVAEGTELEIELQTDLASGSIAGYVIL